MRTPEKSNSVPDVSNIESESPPNYIATRYKRKRSSEVNIAQVQDMTIDLKNEMKDLINKVTESQTSQINTIMSTLKDIQQTNNIIQCTLLHLSEENKELKSKIENLEQQQKKDRDQIIILHNKLEEYQRTDRKSNIEIKNVPLKGNENKKDLLHLVTKLCGSLEVKIEQTEVKDIIKTKKQNQERSTLIVEFTNTFVKMEILKAAKLYNNKYKTNKLSAKHLGLKANPDTPIFVSENLTPMTSRLFFLARDFKQSNKYKYCWTSYGKVYLRQNDDSPIVHITNESQIQQLLKK